MGETTKCYMGLVGTVKISRNWVTVNSFVEESQIMDRLILFDIDGTILNTGGAGKWAMVEALKEVFGRNVPHEGYRMSGKTEFDQGPPTRLSPSGTPR